MTGPLTGAATSAPVSARPHLLYSPSSTAA
jgi:hypothetical protein